MSDEIIKSLNRRIDELQNENSSLKSEARDRRIKGKKLREEHTALQKTVTQLEGERDGWQKKYESSPSELQTKLDEATGKYRSLLHKGAFEKKASAHKVRPDAVEALWKLSDYQADGDEVDEAKLEKVFADAKEHHAYLFEPEGTNGSAGTNGGANGNGNGNGAPSPRQLLTGAVGAGRGGSDLGPSRFVVRKADSQSPDWMMKNQKRIAEAAENGTLVYVD